MINVDIDITIGDDETRSTLFRLLDAWPDDEPTRVPDRSFMPAIPWVCFVTLPLDREWLRNAPESEAFQWLDKPQLADSAMRPQFEGTETVAFTGPTPADALASAQRHLRLARRGLR